MEAAPCRVLIIGETEVARLTCTALAERGCSVVHLVHPSAEEVAAAIEPGVTAVAVLVRGDVVALRYALLAEHAFPLVRLVVTLFDRTVGEELVRVVPNCLVTSPADVAVPALVGGCLGDEVLALVEDDRDGPVLLLGDPDDPQRRPWRVGRSRARRWRHGLAGQLRPVDDSGRTLLLGLGLLSGVLAVDGILSAAALHESPVQALFAAVRTVATVGPAGPEVAPEHPLPGWYLVVAAVLMLVTIAATAIFTAGLVNRLLSPRLTGILGRRVLPRRDHVVVIGLGQVGVRLAARLRSLGVPVVGVERLADAAGLRHLKRLGVPVVVGDGSDRDLLERLHLDRAVALAAMGSEDLDNVEVAIASLAVAPGLRVVLRAGDDAVISETRSLFRIGQVRHVSALSAAAVTSAVLDATPRHVYQDGHRLVVVHQEGVRVCDPFARCDCD